MAEKLIDGKKIADEFCDVIKERVNSLKASGIYPKIALIKANNDPASEIYISKKIKTAEFVGIQSDVYKFGSDVREKDIIDLIKKLNIDASVHAILLQSPLANGLNFRKLVDLIDPNKDVDGLTTFNQGCLFTGEPGIVPCTPLSVLHLLRTVRDQLAGLHAVVLGRSSIVGSPMYQLLLNANCTITVLHSYSRDVPEICSTADILISAIGKPYFIKKYFVKPGATIIDVGINKIIDENGAKKIVGDVDFCSVFEIAGAITPVPNGVGPMTVVYLMHNTLKLACCCRKE